MRRNIWLIVLSVVVLSGCGVQSIPRAKNKVEASLAEISNQYKRRADLVPNLVKVVKGYAAHEKETLQAVVEARAKATQTTIDLGSVNPEQIQKFQQAQGELTQALSRLLVTVERYPNLKANQNFLDLQAQLEGTENRITVARQRYIDSIRQFNDLVTVFPTNLTNSLFFQYEKLPQWEADASENVEKVPKIEF